MIEKIADRMINGNDTTWEMNIDAFDWNPGVGLYGIWNAYKKTGEQRYFDFLTKWFDKHLREAYKQITINSVAPLLTAAEMYHETGNEDYYKVCCDLADYVTQKAPLTSAGGLEHTVTEKVEGFAEQMWADTLFMACLFAAKFGVYSGRKEYCDFAVKQLKTHLKYLCDNETGLFFHGYSCITKDHLSGVHWGRANAWIIYSSCEIMETLGDFDGIDEVKAYVKRHADALRRVQRATGGFATVLDCEDSYTETSAAAGIAAGLKKAEKLGICADVKDMYEKTAELVKASVNENGEVMHVSTGTPIMKDVHAYMDIPCRPTLYGQALSILALL